MICAFFLAPSKICQTKILRPPSRVFLSDFGAKDEARCVPCEDDNPKRAENTGSAAGSDSSCYPSLSGLEPIRFLSANICLYFGKNSCNIRILLQIFASSFLNICSIETENTHRRINFRWIWVARAADKCGLFKASDAKRRENLSPRGLLVRAHLGYPSVLTVDYRRLRLLGSAFSLAALLTSPPRTKKKSRSEPCFSLHQFLSYSASGTVSVQPI